MVMLCGACAFAVRWLSHFAFAVHSQLPPATRTPALRLLDRVRSTPQPGEPPLA